MKTLVGTPAELTAACAQISAARGYPKRGQVYRRDPSTGELQHVTGDRRYDVGTVTTFAPELLLTDDGKTAYCDVDTDARAVVPPEVVRFLKDEATLPQDVKDARERRKAPPIDLPGALAARTR